MRKYVFRHPDTLEKYEKCLDEIEIWAKWKDKIPLTLACQVRYFIEKNASAPRNGLEHTFIDFFDANYTFDLAEYFLDSVGKTPSPKGIRRKR